MRKLLTIIFLLSFFIPLVSQVPVGSWSDHLNYGSAVNVAAGTKKIFASTGSSLMVYDKEYSELRKLSRVDGLTETGISTIGWSEQEATLVVAYQTANIDILRNNIIFNIPDISRKYIPGKKEINRIRTNGRYAYLACSFGIVVLDLAKKEIWDTWRPGTISAENEVWDIAFGDGKVYAATGSGVFSGNLNDPGLAYSGNWSRIKTLPSHSAKYNLAVYAGSRLYVNRVATAPAADSVFVINSGCSLFSSIAGTNNLSFDTGDDGFTISSGTSVRQFSQDGILLKTISSYPWRSPDARQAVSIGGSLWIADYNSGLVRYSASQFESLTLPGPVSNSSVSVTSLNGKTIICGGGVDASWNNLWKTYQVSVLADNQWNQFTSSSIYDPNRALIDPFDPDHFFIASWGGGLLEYRNNILVNRFTEANSPLQTIIPGRAYVRIGGLAMDSKHNLWISQSEVPGNIKVLRPDGTFLVNPATIDFPTVADILIARSGIKWIVLPRGNTIFVLDDKGTPEQMDDDRSRVLLVTDTENKAFSNVYCITEDLDGNIWAGTDQGPLIYYNPDDVLDSDIRGYRVKIPRNDGTGLADYMLGTETITSIAVDGANRKWLGTLNSGAYLLSPDGTEKLKNYNTDNSPIYSNAIASVAVDNKTGEVWFATSKGTISLRGNATEGNENFRKVYSFPNPVREGYTGNVTITGLMRNTEIKITDVSGNLVYKTVSDGGMATWDLTTYNGRRVSTGVYVVFCSSDNGQEKCTTKILVIN